MTGASRVKRGDYIRVRLSGDDDWTQAFVAAASNGNPSAVMLLFDGGAVRGRCGIICNGLPLTIDYETETAISLLGDAYEIEVAA